MVLDILILFDFYQSKVKVVVGGGGMRGFS